MGTFSTSAKNEMIDALVAGTLFGKLHTGDPGATGTTNAATHTTRVAVSFAAASGGSAVSDADTDWASLAANETITHVSFWDHVSAGTFQGSDDLPDSKAVTTGDTLRVESGDISLAI